MLHRSSTLKLIVLGVSALLLAACANTKASKEPVETTAPAEEPAYTQPVETGPTPGTQEHLNQEAGDRVFFDFDKYNIRPDQEATLRAQAQWLAEFPNVSVVVEGHCDERGTREYNLALGERRANAVKNFLVALGVNASRIETVSYGKERPAVMGSNEDAWAQNRRGVLVVK
jgi:peptidoglycan-associated lipoprotein